MSDLKEKVKKIMIDLENNIKDEKELEYVKTQIYNIYNAFMDEFDGLEEKYSGKMDTVYAKCQFLEDKVKELEGVVTRIQADIYVEDEDDSSIEIECPYCNAEFLLDCSEELRDSVTCPKCNNVIELDWNEHDGCSHDCCGCGEDECHGHYEEDDDDDM